ncbi:uncharacterized protein (TIGR03083 family) [Tamaricihabitans halophyticus]|uniref:Uncharacterized protein (TIGR03083 family) n=1 Tax=Tamaricihabitans halophyticus TaxID=1262583 RepID=A0A4R2QJ08_9PSEU|nr:maleylpyruvate isomerase family mycothiol-dependent enzyme [Tamaricihabitans halophyticus]TCP48448.1 uncharacterized protein (TIGR03083 family) [Tamaricihabitans halophyticus]
MPAPAITKEPLVDLLAAEWSALDELLGELPTAMWTAPSNLPGWTIQDIVAHMLGTELSLLGNSPPDDDSDVTELSHVHNEIGAMNERWVRSFRDHQPAAMRERFREVTTQRVAALRAMSQEDFDGPSWTPAGPGTYGRFMQFRHFDCWIHEQDIRDTAGIPGRESGPSAEEVLDEITRALGFIVGKRAGVPDGDSVTIQVHGGPRRTMHVVVDGRAKVVDQLPGQPSTTLELPAGLFIRLAAGRLDPAKHLDEVRISGDETLGKRIVGYLSYVL